MRMRIRVSKGEEKDSGNPDSWKRNIRKRLRISGQSYVNDKDINVPARKERKKTVPLVVTNATTTSLSPRGKTSLISSGQREMCLDKKTSSSTTLLQRSKRDRQPKLHQSVRTQSNTDLLHRESKFEHAKIPS